MSERRLPLTATDDEGVEHAGEIVIAADWRSGLAPSAGAEFAIILLEQPPASHPESLEDSRTVVCVPADAVPLPKVAAEPRVAYGNGSVAVRLPRRAIDSFARGKLLAAHRISIVAGDVFGGPEVRFEALGLESLSAGRLAQRYWQALYEVLSLPDKPAHRPGRDQIRARLLRLLSKSRRHIAFAEDAAGRLEKLANGLAAPGDLWPAPAELAEDAALIRCVHESTAAAGALASIRVYLDGAAVPERSRDLLFDALATREQLSFVTLLAEPHRIDGMRAQFESFRSRYAAAYARHHHAHRVAAADNGRLLENLRPTANALLRLNTVRALGRPAGARDLASYERLVRTQTPCPETTLEDTLRESPMCRRCGLSLESTPARDEVTVVTGRVHAALARQQSRLAGETVRRILARGGERLEQFVRIVQAADQVALVQVLDDQLLTFIRDLLEQPPQPTLEATALIEELARAYPSIGAEEIDGASNAFRRILRERLSAQHNGSVATPIRLAAERPNDP